MTSMQSAKRAAKSMLRLVFFPVLRYFGPRFHMLHLKLDRTNELLATLSERLDRFEENVAVDLQTAVEYASSLQKTASILTSRTAGLSGAAGPGLAGLDRETADRAAGSLVHTSLEDLGPGAAEFLNWAGSGGESGPQVQAGVWFNPTVAFHHEPGNVRPIFVNERIVEIPYALAAAANLPEGSTVMDVGANESLLSLSLASRGLRVLAIDPRGYPLSHPSLHVIREPVQLWRGPDEPVEAIFCVSTLEHLGVGAYEQEPADLDLDRLVLDRFRSWLKPGGRLVLTVPYGKWKVDEFQRIYDSDRLEDLLKGWSVQDRQAYFHESPFVWTPVPSQIAGEPWAGEEPGVMLVTATPEG